MRGRSGSSALARRTADHLIPPAPLVSDPEWKFLFDGTEKSFNNWRAAGGGAFALVDGCIVTQPGKELGLFYWAPGPLEANFTLQLQFRIQRPQDNSGIHVRFRDPKRPVPDPANPQATYKYNNQAWVAVNTIIDENTVRHMVPQLKQAGARGIVEYPLNKIILD